MNKRVVGTLLSVLAVSAASVAHADDAWSPGSTHLSLEGGLAAGGDKLATVIDTGGGTHDIHAGNSLFSNVGVQHNFGTSDFSLRATAGFSYTGVSASNANISFTYLPVNLLGIYSVGNSHLGAGLAVHVSPHLDMDGFGPNA